MLEAAFVAWLVALLGDRSVRGIVRVVLGDPERRRLETALAEVSRVAITAMLSEIPIESRRQVSSVLAERFRLAPAMVLDGRTRVRTALVEAIRKQIAPLGDQALNPADGLSAGDRVHLADSLATVAIRSIEQLSQGFPALAPLVAQLNADAAAEREEDLSLKVDIALAMLEQLRQAPTALADKPWLKPGFVPDSIDRLVDALLRIPSIIDDNSRSEILKRLPGPLSSSIPRSSTPRIQAYQILDTCATYPHGLRDLRATIYSFERESIPMLQFDQVIIEIGAMSGSEIQSHRGGQ